MAGYANLKQERSALLDRADGMLRAVENANRVFTASEEEAYRNTMGQVADLDKKLSVIEKQNTIRQLRNPEGLILPGVGTQRSEGRPFIRKQEKKVLSEDYLVAYSEWVQSGFTKTSAALYEGLDSAGGYAVPIIVSDQIVPLAPQEMAVRQLATVIPTVADIKVPTKASFSVAAEKTETEAFGSTAPTLGQFTLGAYMLGQQNDLSWELAQDVPTFQQFLVEDMLLAQQMLEESFYITGNGSGQPQGLLGNVDVGVAAAEPDTNGNKVSIDATLDCLGTLNAYYLQNASWLLNRETAISIRKAQVGSNLFIPVWTRQNGQDFLHGYPVFYSGYMPNPTAGETPVLFGDFKRGFLIGDRGGSGISVKVLDQPKAASGLITLLTYRRTDSHVRAAEAIRSLTLALS